MIRLPFTRYPEFGVENTEYAYACGLVRALETRLLDKVKIDRLLVLKDIEEVFKALQDTDYGKYLNEIHAPSDFEIMLKKELQRTYKLLDELAVDEYIKVDTRYYYDFHNIRVLVKAFISEKEFDFALSSFGAIEPKVLKTIFENEEFDLLPTCLKDAVLNAIENYYERKDPQLIDLSIDRDTFKYYTTCSESDFIRNYHKLQVDLKNFLTLLRLERIERKDMLKYSILPGGFLGEEIFLEIADSNSLLQEIKLTPYYPVLAPGYSYYQKNGSFIKLEKDIESYLVGFVRETRKKDLGPEPLLGYFYSKRNEIRILRMIMVGKINGIPKELIQERIPEVVG